MAQRVPLLFRLLPPMFGVLCLIVVAIAFELLLRADILNRYIIPLPTEVLASFSRLAAEENILVRFVVTGGEALAAIVGVAIVGGAAGVLLYKSPMLRRATETWVAAFAAAPLILAYPLFLVIFGRSAWTVIAMGFVAGLPPMILKTLEGLSGTRAVLLAVGRSFNLTPSQQLWKIMVPAALPTLFVGLRLAIIFALINIVAIEFLINFGGLGQIIANLAERYDMAGTYAAICIVILVSALIFYSLEQVEKWLRPSH
jgi:ABC-type nitrate/sulfonate/bicarbonate transport system permease component